MILYQYVIQKPCIVHVNMTVNPINRQTYIEIWNVNVLPFRVNNNNWF